MAKRLKLKNVPGIPDGYADEITPEERKALKANNPDIYEGLIHMEKDWEKQQQDDVDKKEETVVVTKAAPIEAPVVAVGAKEDKDDKK